MNYSTRHHIKYTLSDFKHTLLPVLLQSSALWLLFIAFQTLLRSLLLLDGVVEQLLCIVFAHLILGLLLLLLVLILFILLIVLLLILLFLIVFFVFVLLVVLAPVLLLLFCKRWQRARL